MFALSTSWNAWQHLRAKDIIKEIRELGFKRVELNFNLTCAQVKEMIALKDRGQIKVVSVHNFCPLPQGIPRSKASPDIFSLSAKDNRQRQKAISYTERTIDTACRIGAQAVVLHLGKVEIEEKIKRLAHLFKRKDKTGYKKLKAQMQRERDMHSPKFFSQALKSLDRLAEYACRKKIKLGIENRYYFCEIPTPEEMQAILTVFSGAPIYYWHDVGHAQMYENLGFFKHKTLLDRFRQRMLGIHLHDIDGIDDHRAPLKGRFDFNLLKPYVKKETLKVLEPHYPATAEEIIRGQRYLEKLLK